MKKYTASHEWVKIKDSPKGEIEVGLTKEALREIGDIVHIAFPVQDTFVEKGELSCVVESTKAAIDLYAPVSGKITRCNTLLAESKELMSLLASEQGWLYVMQVKDTKELEELLTESAYVRLLGK